MLQTTKVFVNNETTQFGSFPMGAFLSTFHLADDSNRWTTRKHFSTFKSDLGETEAYLNLPCCCVCFHKSPKAPSVFASLEHSLQTIHVFSHCSSFLLHFLYFALTMYCLIYSHCHLIWLPVLTHMFCQSCHDTRDHIMIIGFLEHPPYVEKGHRCIDLSRHLIAS